jgi:hypothetical protein
LKIIKIIWFKFAAKRPGDAGHCLHISICLYMLYGAYGVPAMAWDGNFKSFLFEMSTFGKQ